MKQWVHKACKVVLAAGKAEMWFENILFVFGIIAIVGYAVYMAWGK